MLDPHLLRTHLDDVARAISRRGLVLDTAQFNRLEGERKRLQIETQELQHQRNARSKAIGEAKVKGHDIEFLVAEVADLGERMRECGSGLEKIQAELDDLLLGIPNIPHQTVPDGETTNDNKEIRRWGEPRSFNFAPKDHVDLGDALGMMDFESATRIASSRFVVLTGPLAHLQRALIQFMLDVHTSEHGYTEVYVPFIVNERSMMGTGQLPRFAEDLFAVPQQGFYLIPTAEVPVTNLAQDQIIPADELPCKYVCHTPCFRSEAGSYGKDTRGMIRQHQFEKVELVQLVRPDTSYQALEELTVNAEVILQRLGLHYRMVALCAGDLGFAAAKTYDLEVWMAGQGRYREISSCSNFEAFQARRMKARWRDPKTGKPELLHTLNGSGLAVGRTLIAIMETFQDSEGRIHVPEVLRSYLGGVALIE
ncbi:MAG: serine--tRNA ligase [Gammaproteobacteria bacterium]|nr:serine--tRNA ligase [Gammaproteobacteria bacterium]MCI0590712.1 serine--tRNA ligase [Gammaproteobacteria bacterium]